MEFLQVVDILYWLVCSLSMYDMLFIWLWWEEESFECCQCFCNGELGWWGEGFEICILVLVNVIILQYFNWFIMWMVFLLQDILVIDGEICYFDVVVECINVLVIIQYYWCYCMYLNMEELLEVDSYNNCLCEMLEEVGCVFQLGLLDILMDDNLWQFKAGGVFQLVVKVMVINFL